MKIGLLIQIANFDIFNKIKYIINNFDSNILLMLHLNNILKSEDINAIKNEFNRAIFTYGENKGMDIYGFLLQIEYIINNNIKVDYICKIHTKTNEKWRNDLIYNICGDKDIVNNCIKLMSEFGMICSKRYYKIFDHLNSPILLKMLERYNIENNYIDEIDWRKTEEIKYDLDLFDPYFYITYPYNNIMYDNELLKNRDKLNSYAIFHWLQIGYKHFKFVPNRNLIKKKVDTNFKFVAGTMFWINANILIDFLNKINFTSYFNLFEKKYFNNEKPTFTHSWERLFSIIIYHNNKKIKDI